MIKAVIDRYAAADFDRWHTPGHKGALCARDVTELPDEDWFPMQEIADAQARCAAVYGCGALRFLCGGSSQGIKAAILAADGDLVTGSNNHRAVAEGLELARRQAIVCPNAVVDDVAQPLTAEQIAAALDAHPTAVGALVLSPDYYGQCADLPAIASAVHSRGKLLLVDGAHGAHFAGHPLLRRYDAAGIADVCNLSAHKTLDAYTQSAYLCVNRAALLPRIDHALQLLGTTSPNYLFYERLEEAAQQLLHACDAYERLRGLCTAFAEAVPCLPVADFTRLTVDCKRLNTDGFALTRALIRRRIMPEKTGRRYVVLIATPHDTPEKFDRLIKGIRDATR